MKEKNNLTPIAIIIGAIIISISIYYVYDNTPQVQMMKSCKNIIKKLGLTKNSMEAGLVMTRCINGEL